MPRHRKSRCPTRRCHSDLGPDSSPMLCSSLRGSTAQAPGAIQVETPNFGKITRCKRIQTARITTKYSQSIIEPNLLFKELRPFAAMVCSFQTCRAWPSDDRLCYPDFRRDRARSIRSRASWAIGCSASLPVIGTIRSGSSALTWTRTPRRAIRTLQGRS